MSQQRHWSRRTSYSVLRQAARLTSIFGYQMRSFGRDNYPTDGGALVCSNHQSYFDPVIVGLTCNRRLNYLARKSLFKYAPFRLLIEHLDAIALDREGLGISGIKETIRRLRSGQLVLIFPEG